MARLFIGNVDRQTKNNELWDAFRTFGPVRNVWVARNPPGFAYVEFEDARDAEDAIKGMQQRQTRWRVELAKGGHSAGLPRRGRSRSPRRRRRSPSPRRARRRSPSYGRSRSRSRRRSRSRSRSRDLRRRRSPSPHRGGGRRGDRSRRIWSRSRSRSHSRGRRRSRTPKRGARRRSPSTTPPRRSRSRSNSALPYRSISPVARSPSENSMD